MDYYQILAISISAAVVLIAIVITIILVIRKKKNKKEEEFPDLLEALGGKDNILEVTSKGSRLNVKVDNKKIIDKEKIKEQGVDTIVISSKKVTLVIGVKKAQLVEKYLTK